MRGTPLFGKRVYARLGPEPRCPLHGPLTWTLGGWSCDWKQETEYVARNGFTGVRVDRCNYKPHDRRETEIEQWTDEIDSQTESDDRGSSE